MSGVNEMPERLSDKHIARKVLERVKGYNSTQSELVADLRVKLEAAILCMSLVNSQLSALRKQAANDELPELCEELTGIISIIEAAMQQEKP